MRERVILGLVVASATVGLLGPALKPGYVLTYDMVFVPRQSSVPAAWGLADVLPRAVPQDVVLWLLTSLAPGSWWQHLMLVLVVVGGATGVARLLRDEVLWQRCLGALLYVWSAYVVERLVMGSWPLLVAFAALPWAVGQALNVRRGISGAGGRLILLLAVGSLAPSSWALIPLVALPIAVGPGSRAPIARRAAVLAATVALQLPWIVPALTSPVRAASDPGGVAAFALRPEGPWGPLLTALGTGGVWNADAVPASRSTALGVIGALLVIALAALGANRSVAVLGRSGALVLLAVAGVGVMIAVAGATWPIGLGNLLALVPGGGQFRDGQRLLAPLTLLLALVAPLGARRVTGWVVEPLSRRVLVCALLALPVIVLPDAAWGSLGRLAAVEYPSDWKTVADRVAESSAPGDVTVLPWGTFREFDWNEGRTALDPAPRWMARATVVDDTLLVRRRDGTLQRVSGESARAAAIGAAVEAGGPLLPALQRGGIGFVVVERGTAGAVRPSSLAGLREEFVGTDLILLSVPGTQPWPPVEPWRVSLVALAWLLASATLVSALVTASEARRRFSAQRGKAVVP